MYPIYTAGDILSVHLEAKKREIASRALPVVPSESSSSYSGLAGDIIVSRWCGRAYGFGSS